MLRDVIDHVIVLMLENQSFDRVLGFLSEDRGGLPPSIDQYTAQTNSSAHSPPHLFTREQLFHWYTDALPGNRDGVAPFPWTVCVK